MFINLKTNKIMKRGLIILGLAIAGLSGCKSVDYVQSHQIYAIDSTSVAYEDRNNPGTFINRKDTVRIMVTYKEIINRKGFFEADVKYRLIDKQKK